MMLNLWFRDIEQLSKIGVKNYRFSLSWARLLPDGTRAGGMSKAGVEHYSKFIDDLIWVKMIYRNLENITYNFRFEKLFIINPVYLAAGIEPYVTLYHWDLPQALQDKYDGWADTGDQIVKLSFQHFNDC